MRDLYIVGAGGHGRETLDIVEAINRVAPTWNFKGFVADDPGDEEVLARRDAAVVMGSGDLARLSGSFVIAIGDGEVRRKIDERTGSVVGRSPALVHPTAVVAAAGGELGDGVLVPAGCSVGAGVRIGGHATLNVNVAIEAGCQLGNYSTISPGCLVEAGSEIGQGVFLGTGSTVRAGVRVGDRARVGAGAVVETEVAMDSTVAGIPAEVLPY